LSQLERDLGDLLLDTLFLHGSADFLLSQPLSLLGVLKDKLRCGLNNVAHRILLLGGFCCSIGVGSDLGMGCLVDSLERLAAEGPLPFAELLSELGGRLSL